MVKRSKYAIIPTVPLGWVSTSCQNWRDLPFPLLDPSELLFLKQITRRSLFSKQEFLDLLYACFGHLISHLCEDSLSRHLFVGECYADREYHSGEDGSIRVFRLGLVVAVPMPAAGTQFEYWFCYPSHASFDLSPKNFSRPYPPHDVFASFCLEHFCKDLSEDEFSLASSSLLEIPLWHGRKNYVADACYRLHLNGKSEYLWFEFHTGSEDYYEKDFIERLLSAEQFLKGKGRYVVIVPFKRDREKAKRYIRKYNLLAQEDDSKPLLDLQLCEIITFQHIPLFREKLGFYIHKKRV